MRHRDNSDECGSESEDKNSAGCGEEASTKMGANRRSSRHSIPRTVARRPAVRSTPVELDVAALTDMADLTRRAAAWEKAFPDLFVYLTGVMRPLVRNDRDDAEDIAEEAIFRAYRETIALEGSTAFRGWLRKIARNYLYDEFRKKKTASKNMAKVALELELFTEYVEPMIEAGETEFISESAYRGRVWPLDRDDLNARIAALPEDQRMLLLAQREGEEGQERLARALGIKPATLRQRYSRLYRRLRGE